MLRLNLFGAPSVSSSAGPVGGRGVQGRRLALLALLACTRGRSLTRDKLIGILWPEAPTERARPQLSDDLYLLRGALGDDVIRSVGDEVTLNMEALECDVVEFERLLEQRELTRAVELFTGPLLDGFYLADGQEWERWLDAERLRLGGRYAAALESLAESAEAQGEFAAAAAWWRRLAAHDPYSGRVSLRLMQALEAAGDRTAALRHARVHEALVREEFDAPPDPEVVALAERLRAEPAPPQPAAPAAPALAAEPEPVGLAAPALEPSPTPPHASPTRRRWPRPRLAAAGLLVLAMFAVATVLAVGAQRRARDGAAPAVASSIGVLPFVNMSADPGNAYFSDGLTEQIITDLSRIQGLQVAARTSSFALRDGALDVRAIGDTLGVAAVLEGSVRRDGNRLRITAQLIDAATGYHIWTEDYERELEDVFAVQEEIARAIAGALQLRLGGAQGVQRARAVSDLEAYDLYLRGLYLRNRLTPDALRQAMDYFDRAIEREPSFALAHAAKASVIGPAVLFGHMPLEPGLAEYRKLTARALELDPLLGEAHAVLGIQRLFFDWDWPAAEQALRRAIELNPSDAHAYHHLANYLAVMGRRTEAVAARERAVQLDPLNARTITLLAGDYVALGDYERALAQYRRAARLDPVHPLILGSGPWLPATAAVAYQHMGRMEEAVADYLRVATLRGASAEDVEQLRAAFDTDGMPGFWRRWLVMDRKQTEGNPDLLRTARLLMLGGDTLGSIELLERAHRRHDPALTHLGIDPVFAGVRTHPRVVRILRAMKLVAP